MRQIRGSCTGALLSPFRFSKINHKLLCLLALLVFLPSLAFAQVDTGTISGTVRDTSGAVVPDAMVTVRNTATGVTRTAQTGGDGVYTFPALPAAAYDLTATKTGFACSKAQTRVTVRSHVTLDAHLSTSKASTTAESRTRPAP